jgi:hypothetical protein
VPGGQGALFAAPMPTAIQKKNRTEIKVVELEISRVAEQTADRAARTWSTNGSRVGLIVIAAVLFARLG